MKALKKTENKKRPHTHPKQHVELEASDYTELERLLDDAATANREELDAAKTVGQLRAQLRVAEFHLNAVKAQAHEVHTKLAPLWHRLPA